MGVEKRKYPRVKVKFSVEYRGKNVWQNAEIDNISRGGMFIVTEKIEPPGTNIELIFELGESKRKIQAQGVVVWTRTQSQHNHEGRLLPQGMGVQFTKIFPGEAENFLADLIEKWRDG